MLQQAASKNALGSDNHPQVIRLRDIARRIIPNSYNRIPGFSVAHHHFMPGFPVMAWPMMEWVLDTYYGDQFHRAPREERSFLVFGLPESRLTPLMERILYEVKRIVVGQDHFLERVLVAILIGSAAAVSGAAAEPLAVDPWSKTIGAPVPPYAMPAARAKMARTVGDPTRPGTQQARTPHDKLDGIVTDATLSGDAPADYPFAPELAFTWRLAKHLKPTTEQVEKRYTRIDDGNLDAGGIDIAGRRVDVEHPPVIER